MLYFGKIKKIENSNVGIGTTSPVGKLHVNSSDGTPFVINATNDGNVGIGTTSPQAQVHSVGADSASNWAGDTTNYYGGGAASYGTIFGNQYGAGAGYSYGVQNTTTYHKGGNAGGYFKGGSSDAYSGGGAGIVAIGGDAGTPQNSLAQGGAGIYAQGGLNDDSTTRAYAGYFNGNTVVMNGNVGIGTTAPTAGKLQISNPDTTSNLIGIYLTNNDSDQYGLYIDGA
ncbi:hypothetical protein KJ671_03320, partial [Patescibacteria group bacterium]|nr:hypothetical protein [Patescibacteria group bacterium]